MSALDIGLLMCAVLCRMRVEPSQYDMLAIPPPTQEDARPCCAGDHRSGGARALKPSHSTQHIGHVLPRYGAPRMILERTQEDREGATGTHAAWPRTVPRADAMDRRCANHPLSLKSLCVHITSAETAPSSDLSANTYLARFDNCWNPHCNAIVRDIDEYHCIGADQHIVANSNWAK
jgi:hypothetical protein